MNVPKDKSKRRAGGAIRVPFVRRCVLDFGDDQPGEAFLVNINVLGGYLARDTMPALGREVVCRFHVPGRESQVAIPGVVAWTNPGQDHPVHSLPPGFGVAFRDLSEESRSRIEEVVFDYLARQKT